MSAEQAPKRRSSSIIERSQYAPARPQDDDRRRKLDSLARDPAAAERAKQEIAEIARQQRGQPRAAVQLDDLEVQQRKPMRMVVAPAPEVLPAGEDAATPEPRTSSVSAQPAQPPAVATTKKARASASAPAATEQPVLPPAVATTKQVSANAPAPAARIRFEHIERQPARAAAPARPMPAAYARDERYAPHEVYPYWEAPIALARSNPLLLMLLAVLVCVPVIWMLMQRPTTVISSYNGSGWTALGNVASNVLHRLSGSEELPSIDVPADEHSILGQPSITEEQIEAVLAQYNSPARGTGKIWLALGQQYGIDPAYPLAFFVQESTAGTNSGWAGMKPDGSTTHNVGNIICAGYATCYKGNRDYPSWEAGIDDWYRLIAKEYVKGRGLASVEQILPIYCPVSDGCRSYDYISIVNSMVEKWHQGQLFR